MLFTGLCFKTTLTRRLTILLVFVLKPRWRQTIALAFVLKLINNKTDSSDDLYIQRICYLICTVLLIAKQSNTHHYIQSYFSSKSKNNITMVAEEEQMPKPLAIKWEKNPLILPPLNSLNKDGIPFFMQWAYRSQFLLTTSLLRNYTQKGKWRDKWS